MEKLQEIIVQKEDPFVDRSPSEQLRPVLDKKEKQTIFNRIKIKYQSMIFMKSDIKAIQAIVFSDHQTAQDVTKNLVGKLMKVSFL